jgi:hypothetical protein
MKNNSLNIVLVVLAFVVLGCSCPNMADIQKKIDEGSKKTETNSSPSNSAVAPKKSGETSSISVVKYDRLKNGMTLKEAIEIMGDDGEEMQASEAGKFKIVTYKWSGEDYSYIIATFMNDKLQSKSKGGLK